MSIDRYEKYLSNNNHIVPYTKEEFEEKERADAKRSLPSRCFHGCFDSLDACVPKKIRMPLVNFKIALLTLNLHSPNYQKYMIGMAVTIALIAFCFYFFAIFS